MVLRMMQQHRPKRLFVGIFSSQQHDNPESPFYLNARNNFGIRYAEQIPAVAIMFRDSTICCIFPTRQIV
jgi:hypothetical protein